jgi:reactive intermediate/imine deaminase
MTYGRRTTHWLNGMIRPAVSRLTLVGCLAAMGASLAPPVAAQSGVRFFPRTDEYPFSSAVQVGDVLYLSGQIGAAEDQKSVVPGGMPAETRRMMELIGQTLNEHGLTYADLFKCTVMLADMKDWPAFNEIYAGYFKRGRYPARSAMGVNGLALGARVEMECWAYRPGHRAP